VIPAPHHHHDHHDQHDHPGQSPVKMEQRPQMILAVFDGFAALRHKSPNPSTFDSSTVKCPKSAKVFLHTMFASQPNSAKADRVTRGEVAG
jgi:hypothetical protein